MFVALLFLYHVACGGVRTPTLASIAVVGLPCSIRHLPPAGGVDRVSHATCLAILPLVIQTAGFQRSAVSEDKEEPGIMGKEVEEGKDKRGVVYTEGSKTQNVTRDIFRTMNTV